MKTWKLISGIVSIVLAVIIFSEGRPLMALAKGFNVNSSYVTMGILSGVLILAAGILSLVNYNKGKRSLDISAVVIYVVGALFCFLGPKIWKNLLVYSVWPIICAIVGCIAVYKSKRAEEYKDVEYDENAVSQNVYNASMQVPSSESQKQECPFCHEMVDSNNKFCGSCGKPLPERRFCPQCGTELSDRAKFCPKCGTKTIE